MASGRPSRRRQISATEAADLRRQLKARVARLRPRHEQRHGGGRKRLAGVAVGRGQRRQWKRPLAREAQDVAAGHQGRHPAARVEQRADVVRRPRDVLEVVEHQQGAFVAQRRDRRVQRRRARRRARAGGVRDRLHDQARVIQRSQVGAHHAAGEFCRHRLGHGERQARLAHPPGPRDRDQPGLRIAEHRGEARDVVLAADELAGGHAPMVARARSAGNLARGAVSGRDAPDRDSSARTNRRRRGRGPRRRPRRCRPSPSRSRCARPA